MKAAAVTLKQTLFKPALGLGAALGLAVFPLPVIAYEAYQAQSEAGGVWRCGAEYTNQPSPEALPTCERLDEVTLSVVRIEGTRVYSEGEVTAPPRTSRSAHKRARPAPGSADKSVASASPTGAAPLETPSKRTQIKRERDAKMILQAELDKTIQRRHTVASEYAKSKNDKLKTELMRLAADEAGLKRELARLAP